MSCILAVEDSAAIRLLLTRRLERAGHRLEAVADAGEAIRLLAEETGSGKHPDLILLDLGLPSPGGIASLPTIRRAAPDVPVVLLSARPDLDRIETPVEVAGRVAKPIDFDRLLILIDDLTG